jgi:prevent-host-death family protein
MRKTSFADAKAHLSELVDKAEHKGEKILILRHGKPAAALVPVSAVIAPPPRPKKRRPTEIEALYAALGEGDGHSAVADLLAGRR